MVVSVDLNKKKAIMWRKTVLIPENDGESTGIGCSVTRPLKIVIFSVS